MKDGTSNISQSQNSSDRLLIQVQGDDYVDKGLAAAEKKVGQMTGHHIDPNSAKIRKGNEKVVSVFKSLCPLDAKVSWLEGVFADG